MPPFNFFLIKIFYALNNCRLQQQSNVVDVHILVTINVYQEQTQIAALIT